MKIWNNWHSHALPVGMQNSTAALENSLENVNYTVKIKCSHLTPRETPQINKVLFT